MRFGRGFLLLFMMLLGVVSPVRSGAAEASLPKALEQADGIARARGFRDFGRAEPASRVYQQVIDTYRDTDAGTLAAKDLADIDPR